MDEADAARRTRLAETTIADLIACLPTTLAARQAETLGWPSSGAL